MFGLVLACALWWAYFDVIALVAERRFRSLPGARARSGWRATRTATSTCRWWPGSCSWRSGIKKTIGHVDEPLETVAAVALFGGVALYHGAHVAFRLRDFGTVNRPAAAHGARVRSPDPGGHGGGRAGGARRWRRGGVGRDRLRGDALQGVAAPDPRRARLAAQVHQLAQVRGDLVERPALGRPRRSASASSLGGRRRARRGRPPRPPGRTGGRPRGAAPRRRRRARERAR